jgi:hypothetical protein
MNGHARLAKALRDNHEEIAINLGIDAILGKLLADGSWIIDIDTRPGWVYVSYNNGARNTVVEALDSGVSRTRGMPVWLFKMNDGQFEVKAAGAKAATYNAEAARYTGNVSYHTHEKGSGLDDWVSPNRFLCGLVRPTNPSSMSVQIEAFWYAGRYIAATTFDLTSAQPATANMWAWIMVAYDPAAQDFVAVTGTEQPVVVPLDEELLADFDMTGLVPLDGVRVREDDSAIPEVDSIGVARFSVEGMRHFLSSADVSVLKYSTANVSNPPTDAELDTAFGTPAEVGAGFIAALNDNGAGTNFYFVGSDGANWWYVAGTKAV